MIRWFKEKLSKRSFKFWWQRRTRGWDDSDTWALDGIIAKFVLPRLRRFKEINFGYPNIFTEESWDEAIDDMIYALEICERELVGVVDDADFDRVERGLELFGKYFRALWW